MIYLYWSIGLVVVVFVVWGVIDRRKQLRAEEILPKIITRDWIEGRDLRKWLAMSGVDLSGASFYLMMSRQDHLVEMTTVQKRIDGVTVSVRKYRKKFSATTAQ